MKSTITYLTLCGLISTLALATCTRSVTKTVYCDETNLMWQDDVNTTGKTWQEAISYCENLTLANYSDWRLPNINELRSVVDYNTSKTNDYSIPAIKDGFENTKTSRYWTSTIYSDSSKDNAWHVWFSDGTDWYQDKTATSNTYIRCVRTK